MDEGLKGWEVINPSSQKLKVDGGYVYRICVELNSGDWYNHQLLFVPDPKTSPKSESVDNQGDGLKCRCVNCREIMLGGQSLGFNYHFKCPKCGASVATYRPKSD